MLSEASASKSISGSESLSIRSTRSGFANVTRIKPTIMNLRASSHAMDFFLPERIQVIMQSRRQTAMTTITTNITGQDQPNRHSEKSIKMIVPSVF
tara:strand:- start:95 stop:382 length:288 start_codon:yes stop_codon:yes gene_type:complete